MATAETTLPNNSKPEFQIVASSSIQSPTDIVTEQNDIYQEQLTDSFFDRLSDDLYLVLMTTMGLSVEDIIALGESGLDSRTEFAFF